ncbi:hypothetical protein [Streptomyces sp. NPDC002187]|uniref:hypothetical protein n=1 Tax=Streptomyces sp. NPDC002187 TaxID=3364637 RepID=UPI003686F606
MTDRSLEALGLDAVPAEDPLAYPGLPVTEPSLLTGDELLRLDVRPRRLGEWYVKELRQPLDEVLARLGRASAGRRHPVLAVGSNASPAQVGHKLTRCGVPAVVPMVPVRVRGVGVGCSGHISTAGYVAGAPYADPGAQAVLVVSWLDPVQLAALDGTEFHYARVLLPGAAFAMTMPSGERLSGAYAYVSAHGVLRGPDGAPRSGGVAQRQLLAALLAGSARLRTLLGPDPATWVERARADRAVRERGTQIFGEEGWVLRRTGLAAYADTAAEPRRYDDLPPLGGSLRR